MLIRFIAPEPFKQSTESRARFNSLDAGILLKSPVTAASSAVPIREPKMPFARSGTPTAGVAFSTSQGGANNNNQGSIAVRAMRSVRSLARIGGWAHMRMESGSHNEQDVRKAEEETKKEKKSKKEKETQKEEKREKKETDKKEKDKKETDKKEKKEKKETDKRDKKEKEKKETDKKEKKSKKEKKEKDADRGKKEIKPKELTSSFEASRGLVPCEALESSPTFGAFEPAGLVQQHN